MARIESDPNYTSPTFSRATAATDPFKKEDVQALAAAMSTHDHTTGKGLVLPAGAIPDGSITSAKIADGTITGGDLAPGAVSSSKLAAGAVTTRRTVTGTSVSPSTTSASYVDVPDMVLSFASGGADSLASELLIFFGISLIAGSGATAGINVSINAGDMLGPGSAPIVTITSGQIVHSFVHIVAVIAGPSALTIKGRWASTTGSSMSCDTTRRQLSVIEFIR